MKLILCLIVFLFITLCIAGPVQVKEFNVKRITIWFIIGFAFGLLTQIFGTLLGI